jgi:hypothetical protein
MTKQFETTFVCLYHAYKLMSCVQDYLLDIHYANEMWQWWYSISSTELRKHDINKNEVNNSVREGKIVTDEISKICN